MSIQDKYDRDHTILTRNLVVRYGSRIGIDGVDLAVPKQSLFGFLGPNGAGKTTTIRALLGFLRADGGDARVFDLDCWKHSQIIKREIGYLPGDLRLYPWMTARIALRIISAVRSRDVSDAGRTLIDRLALDPTVRARKMSRGMRQKLGLIMALAHDPKLLLLDEPTTGLDPITQLEVMRILRERAASSDTTVFFSSHTLSEVEQLCDRVAIVRDGRVVEASTIKELQLRARRRISIQFSEDDASRTLSPPDQIQVVERRSNSWIAELDGPATALTRWLNENHALIADFAVGPPDLETVFHQYYRRADVDTNGSGKRRTT